MTDGPLVSVITPFLDEGRFLDEAIDSVRAQDYANWELVLVDDGSTDASTEIAKRAAAEDPRVRWMDHPGHENRGKNASRNAGIERAGGSYITFLDGDDVFLPETLARQVEFLELHPEAAMTYGSADWWYWSPEGPVRPEWCDGAGLKVSRPDSVIAPPELVTLFLRDGGALPCLHTVAVRAHVLARTGAFEPWFPGLYEDQVLIARVCLEYPVYVTGAVLARYRQHDEQSCAQADDAAEAAARSCFLAWLSDRIDQRGVRDPDLDMALRDAIGAMATTAAD